MAKGVKEQIVPVGTGGEDDPHHHPPFLSELVETLVFFDGEVLVVGLLQLRRGHPGQINNLPDHLLPQLGLQPLDKLRCLSGAVRGLENFDTFHALILSLCSFCQTSEVGQEVLGKQLGGIFKGTVGPLIVMHVVVTPSGV